MRIRLRRDAQQWILDRAINDTGRVFHFQGPERGGLPRSVKQHDMISKHLGRAGLRLRSLAQAAERRGHRQTALEHYYTASAAFMNAQHTIFETNEEKRLLHGLGIDAYDRVRELAPYPIERVALPFEGKHIHANLHLLADRPTAPTIISFPAATRSRRPILTRGSITPTSAACI